MYQKIDWPVFAHQLGRCFNCNGALDGVAWNSVAGGIGGAWHQYCAPCNMQTFYDTPGMDGDNAKGVEQCSK